MRSLLLSSTLTLLLSACYQHREVVHVPSDPRVLHGNWIGSVTDTTPSVQVLLDAPGAHVYQLQRSVEQQRVIVRDVTSGKVLREAVLPKGMNALGIGIRTDNTLVVVSPEGSKLFDATTLVMKGDAPAGVVVSEDGRRIGEARDGTVIWHSTVGGETVSVPSRSSWLTPASVSANGNVFLSQEQAVTIEPRSAINATPKHTGSCGSSSPTSVDVNPAGQLAVGYSDGWLELRSTDGSLLRAVQLSERCGGVRLVRFNADHSISAVTSYYKVSFHRVTDTVTLVHQLEHHDYAESVSIRGDALVLPIPGGAVGFTSRGGAWKTPVESRSLMLQLTARHHDSRKYTFSGSMQLGDTQFEVDGEALGAAVEFRPQHTPPMIQWTANVRQDAQVVGKLRGLQHLFHHGEGVSQESAQLTLNAQPASEFEARFSRMK